MIMKKQIRFMAIFLLAMISTRAQKPETAQLLVHYKFTHVKDTTNRSHPYTENMVLYIGKTAGAYWSYDRIAADDQFKKAWNAAVANSPDGHVMINRRGAGTSSEYYQYPNEQKIFTKESIMGNSYLIESPIPAIKWEISNDTASFGGLHCQKATGHFKGRDYIVWFCPELPLHIGPWKLNGLPGVIVDAHDTKNEVVFRFDGIEKALSEKSTKVGDPNAPEKDLPPILRGLNYDPNLIQPPVSAINTTQKEFDQLKETMRKDPRGFAQAVSNANAANGIKMDVAIGKPLAEPVFNNPIELPEHK
jgi:GLPGLI family protein